MNVKELEHEYLAATYGRQNVTFVRGEGSFLFDEQGKRYIDFGAGIAVNGLGHGNKKWLSAVTEQAAKLAHASNLYYTEPMAKLAEVLCERSGMKRVFFGNSGAEANECALKTARKYASDKGRGTDIITLKNSFHGRTMATLSATGQDGMHKDFAPFLPGFVYAEANGFEDFRRKCTPDVAAVMLELVQGEGGVIALEKSYVQRVAEYAAANDVLLIIDEVQTGNGRTGTLYAYMQYGVQPDVFTTAKGLGNGLPIGVCLFGEKTQSVLTPGTHGSTFGGNPVACAGALAVLEQIDDELLEGVKRKDAKITSVLSSCRGVLSVSGLGLMIGVECKNARDVMNRALENGLVVLTAHEKLRLLPALNIEDDVLDAGLSVLSGILS